MPDVTPDETPETFEVTVTHAPFGKHGSITYTVTNRTGRTIDNGTVIDGQPRCAGEQTYNVPAEVTERLMAMIAEVQGDADAKYDEDLETRREAGSSTRTETVSLGEAQADDNADGDADDNADGDSDDNADDEPEPTATASTGYVSESERRRREEQSNG